MFWTFCVQGRYLQLQLTFVEANGVYFMSCRLFELINNIRTTIFLRIVDFNGLDFWVVEESKISRYCRVFYFVFFLFLSNYFLLFEVVCRIVRAVDVFRVKAYVAKLVETLRRWWLMGGKIQFVSTFSVYGKLKKVSCGVVAGIYLFFQLKANCIEFTK